MAVAENTNTALLIMEMQVALLQNLPNAQPMLDNVAHAIAYARKKGIPVIYVVVGFRSGLPEISIYNKSFAASKERFSSVNPEDFVKIEPSIAPASGEITITKRRFSAFTGSDLEVILRANGIQQLVLSGIITSGVVLSTVREAADKDYSITVLADCCADRDNEVHEMLMHKIFPRQAEVINVADWVK
ncbi:cysteine hydrolase family protein [Mucilaginibacter segetis]|uniref:Cysteine hydrolase n=1 Tax=Mucilaginibacter segetis TaxID=2793071 RepID=A0A934PRX4_9SPHI|nr:isochorismatase family cysteine hydrolase [Mucilaginibacter segetis]MBK0377848.1 cysteine hydrolase [Mucilaginibacter segetis]